MSIILFVVIIAAMIVFGPGFLIQAVVGYIIGSLCGLFASAQIKHLHREICGYTNDDPEDADSLAKYVAGASRIGGVICPVIPLISVGVGVYCWFRRQRLESILVSSAHTASLSKAADAHTYGSRSSRREVRL